MGVRTTIWSEAGLETVWGRWQSFECGNKELGSHEVVLGKTLTKSDLYLRKPLIPT